MFCQCKYPKKLPNDANGIKFDVCAKSLGGCGEEIGGEEKPKQLSEIAEPEWGSGFPGAILMNPSRLHKPVRGPCEYACCGKPGERRRQNTAYDREEANWGTFCDEHQEEVDEYWKDMWKDYWSGRL